MAEEQNNSQEVQQGESVDHNILETLNEADKNQLISDLKLPVAINILAEDEDMIREVIKDSGHSFDDLNDIQNYEMMMKRLRERFDNNELDDFVNEVTDGRYTSDLAELEASIQGNKPENVSEYFGAKPEDNTLAGILSVSANADTPIEDYPDEELRAMGKFFATNLAKYGVLAAAAPMMGFAAPAFGALLLKGAISKIGFKILAETGVMDAVTQKLAEKVKEVAQNNPEKLSKKKAVVIALAGGAAALAMVGAADSIQDILESKAITSPIVEGVKDVASTVGLDASAEPIVESPSPISSQAYEAVESANEPQSISPISGVVQDILDEAEANEQTLGEFEVLKGQLETAEAAGNTEAVETIKGEMEYLSEVTGVEIPAEPEMSPDEHKTISPISGIVKDIIEAAEAEADTVSNTMSASTETTIEVSSQTVDEQTLKINKDDTLSEVVFDHVFRVNGYSFDSAGDADVVFKAIADKYYDGNPDLIYAGDTLTLPDYDSPEEMMKDLGLQDKGISVNVGEPRPLSTDVEIIAETKAPSVDAPSDKPSIDEPLDAPVDLPVSAPDALELFDKIEFQQLERSTVQTNGHHSDSKMYLGTPTLEKMIDNSGVSMTDAQKEWFVQNLEGELAEYNSHNPDPKHGLYNAPVLTQEVVNKVLEAYPVENNIEFAAKSTISNLDSSVYYNDETGNLNATRSDMTISDFAAEIVARRVENGDIDIDSGKIAEEITKVTSELRSANTDKSEFLATVQLPASMHNVDDMGFDRGGMFDESKFEDVFSELGAQSREYSDNAHRFADAKMPITEGNIEANNDYLAKLNEMGESKFSKVVYDEDSGELKATFMGQTMNDFADVIVQNHIEDSFVDPEKHDLAQYRNFILGELQTANSGVSTDEPIAKLNVGDVLHGSENIGVREADFIADNGFESVNEKIEAQKEKQSTKTTSKMKVR
ncbi:hypothetical protein [Vibrio crassostreae]|uniref:hypothetical protein n=1 Tax=Vibrio crassostreae TaxID=246167 RepID=UPI001B30DF03|nr:hypothetical protein [Vibrio crassostreae]